MYNSLVAHHLAQINIGRLVAPINDPRIAGFVNQLDPVNALADASPGFVWRLQSASGNATDMPYDDDPLMIVNMSVWASFEALKGFVYSPRHLDVVRSRAAWFQKLDRPHACLWWVRAGHIPTVDEGRERLMQYQEHGPTAHAFWFPQRFPAPFDEAACA